MVFLCFGRDSHIFAHWGRRIGSISGERPLASFFARRSRCSKRNFASFSLSHFTATNSPSRTTCRFVLNHPFLCSSSHPSNFSHQMNEVFLFPRSCIALLWSSFVQPSLALCLWELLMVSLCEWQHCETQWFESRQRDVAERIYCRHN